jgi:Skp family chaperone for outer membrane proteins
MRNEITKIFGVIVVSLFLYVSSFAQNKIAIVNTDAFYNEKTGIKKLANAFGQIGIIDFDEMFQVGNLNSKIEALEKYIDTLPCDDETLTSKSKRLKELKDELKITEEKLRQRYKTYDSENIEPIRVKIREKLKEFSKEKGYGIILDKPKLEESTFFIYEDEYIDLTNEFIKFCNEEFEKEASERRASSRH